MEPIDYKRWTEEDLEDLAATLKNALDAAKAVKADMERILKPNVFQFFRFPVIETGDEFLDQRNQVRKVVEEADKETTAQMLRRWAHESVESELDMFPTEVAIDELDRKIVCY